VTGEEMRGMAQTGGEEGKARPSVEESVGTRWTFDGFGRLRGVSERVSPSRRVCAQ